MNAGLAPLLKLQSQLRECRRCNEMIGPVIVGQPAMSGILQLGQAPGAREGQFGMPFSWTAGKTLFGWYRGIGVDEEQFRQHVYMAAVCRCFPGKNPKGGDRVPGPAEVANCADWLQREMALVKPDLVIPVGKLAIAQFLDFKRLTEVVGRCHRLAIDGRETDLVPLPHPSGASTWHRVEPGKALLQDALKLIAEHPAWCRTFVEKEDKR